MAPADSEHPAPRRLPARESPNTPAHPFRSIITSMETGKLGRVCPQLASQDRATGSAGPRPGQAAAEAGRQKPQCGLQGPRSSASPTLATPTCRPPAVCPEETRASCGDPPWLQGISRALRRWQPSPGVSTAARAPRGQVMTRDLSPCLRLTTPLSMNPPPHLLPGPPSLCKMIAPPQMT